VIKNFGLGIKKIVSKLSWKRTLNEAAAVNEKKVMSIVEELA
jgi:hypothetical protein